MQPHPQQAVALRSNANLWWLSDANNELPTPFRLGPSYGQQCTELTSLLTADATMPGTLPPGMHPAVAVLGFKAT